VDDESKLCLNVTLHVDLDSHENFEDISDLVEQHMFGYFFTIEDIDQREQDFLRRIICILPPFHSSLIYSDDK